ncbi:hypothetical protein L6452_41453 [Arctium lappa]|uniref:Uncharacterized protein n=1 Tax=Arctium lappa TaxID=4217 RepID=A0ACB8XP85_ARCLA|nr:hypothetical protein L6452_41453 [Arctium lappa]
MANGRSPNRFTTIVLSLSIILTIMIPMKECDRLRLSSSCNGSSLAECQMFAEEEQEFLMATEEHRRILATTTRRLTYVSLERRNTACSKNCVGKYNVKGRPCRLYQRCK